MYRLICKLFISNYQDKDDTKVREKYGTVFSIFSIACNIVMVVFKLFVSVITNSISIRADAINNLSDVGSNLATLFGFKLSNKHPDSDHPYGHGRMEYISGLIVSFLILLVGYEALKESIMKIIKPQEIIFSNIAIILLIVSICIKLLMCYVNNKAGKDIGSDALKAAGKDSFNDALMTTVTLVSLLIFKFTNEKLNIDPYAGALVSVFVLIGGIGIFKEVLDTILGKAPEKELVKNIEKTILAHKEIHGIHDLMIHDYGPSQKFMSVHVEVDAKVNVIETHDLIDCVENELLEKYGILTTIHMDPIDYSNKEYIKIREEVIKIVKEINPEYTIHDFRMVDGTTHKNLIFDCLLPSSDRASHEEVAKKIKDKVSKLNRNYYCVIKVEHSFVE